MAGCNARETFELFSDALRVLEAKGHRRRSEGRALTPASERKQELIREIGLEAERILDRFSAASGFDPDQCGDPILIFSTAVALYDVLGAGQPRKWNPSVRAKLLADYNRLRALRPTLLKPQTRKLLAAQSPYCNMRHGEPQWPLSPETLRKQISTARKEAAAKPKKDIESKN